MVFKDLALRASWMYEREHVRALIKMAQPGVLKLGKADWFGGYCFLSVGEDGGGAGQGTGGRCFRVGGYWAAARLLLAGC